MFKKEILDIIDSTHFEVELGIKIELRDFFEGAENIETYNITIVNEEQYTINIKLREFSFNKAKESFYCLMNFIQYSYLNLFAFEKESQKLEVIYYSINSHHQGISLKLIYG